MTRKEQLLWQMEAPHTLDIAILVRVTMVVLENQSVCFEQTCQRQRKSNKQTGLRGVNLPALLIVVQARSCPKLVSIAPVKFVKACRSLGVRQLGQIDWNMVFFDSNLNLISQVNRKKLIRHFQLWCVQCL